MESMRFPFVPLQLQQHLSLIILMFGITLRAIVIFPDKIPQGTGNVVNNIASKFFTNQTERQNPFILQQLDRMLSKVHPQRTAVFAFDNIPIPFTLGTMKVECITLLPVHDVSLDLGIFLGVLIFSTE